MRVVLAAAAAAFLLFGGIWAFATATPKLHLPLSAVKMVAPMWTGSGVHIGNGFILTAGHVTDGLTNINVLLSDGSTAVGEVLWTNSPEVGGYDVSLVYVPGLKAEASPLSCAPTHTGEDVSIIGNPGPLTFLETWGKVSGPITAGQWYVWKSLVALDIVSAPGVSGGPVFDAGGEVVGILVSGLIIEGRGNYAYSMMVPGTAICHLLGRVA